MPETLTPIELEDLMSLCNEVIEGNIEAYPAAGPLLDQLTHLRGKMAVMWKAADAALESNYHV